MSKNPLDLNSTVEISWDFENIMYLESVHGLFKRSNPDYGGDNSSKKSEVKTGF